MKLRNRKNGFVAAKKLSHFEAVNVLLKPFVRMQIMKFDRRRAKRTCRKMAARTNSVLIWRPTPYIRTV